MDIQSAPSKKHLLSQSHRSLQRTLVRHVANGRTTDMAGAPLRVGCDLFTDPERLKAEKALLARLPLVAGLSTEIAESGDTLLFEAGGTSIIVVRGQQGQLNAFLNLCTHRGSQLVKACGHYPSLSCPFHGWTFDPQGKLVGQPGHPGFAGIDHADLGLIGVPCTERYGLIFVKALPGAGSLEHELTEFLGDFGDVLALLGLEDYVAGKSCLLEAKANWKYMSDTFGEGYHFAALHPDTVGGMLFTNVAACESFGVHHRVCYAPKSYRELVGKPESEWPDADAVVYSIFPNTQLLVGIPRTEPGPDVLQLHRLYPDTPSSARSLYTVYVRREFYADAGGREWADAVFDLGSMIVGTEDFAAAANAQRMLVSAPQEFSIIYGRNELLLQNYQRNVATAVGMPIGII